MEICNCKCGKSKVAFNPVGEYLYSHDLDNVEIEDDGSVLKYKCKSCRNIITSSDKMMMISSEDGFVE